MTARADELTVTTEALALTLADARHRVCSCPQHTAERPCEVYRLLLNVAVGIVRLRINQQPT